jgi:hypothetical protein
MSKHPSPKSSSSLGRYDLGHGSPAGHRLTCPNIWGVCYVQASIAAFWLFAAFSAVPRSRDSFEALDGGI